MEFRHFFLTAWYLLFCKEFNETKEAQSKFHELNIYIYISNIYLCTYIYTYTHIHTHTHTYIYIYIYIWGVDLVVNMILFN